MTTCGESLGKGMAVKEKSNVVACPMPIEVRTKGGFPARVTSFDPTDGARCFHGTVSKAGEAVRTHWRSNGMARDAHPDFNIDANHPEIVSLKGRYSIRG